MRPAPAIAVTQVAVAALCTFVHAPVQTAPTAELQLAQGAGSPGATSGAARGAEARPQERFGTAANGMPFDREVRLRANTKSVAVWRFEIINFVGPEGREFRWRFDTAHALDAFPLDRIAPAGVAVPAATTVYVNGEIPIAP